MRIDGVDALNVPSPANVSNYLFAAKLALVPCLMLSWDSLAFLLMAGESYLPTGD